MTSLHSLIVAALLAAPADTSIQEPSKTPTAQHQHAAEESLFRTREASGTAWLPDETTMYGLQRHWGGWDVMMHGAVFGQYLYEQGYIHRTGGFQTHQFGSVNWGMFGARRRIRTGYVGFRAMASLDPWTVPGCGSINLLATGEICDGDTIHDRQHPHDLLMELAVEYDRPLRNGLRWQLYAGLAGEPALGPAGFPHRLSALVNPIAPVAHHWLDSSHITFGLVTTGIYTDRWKAEASLFNGREPDVNRADLDLARLDSFSGRMSLMVTRRLALQFSGAHLHEAEAEFGSSPRSDVDRFTGSATYHRPFSTGIWASTLAYGFNSGNEIIPEGVIQARTSAVMLESTATVADRHTLFGRGEIVQKPAHDLHAHAFSTRVCTVGKIQAGYVRHFRARRGVLTGIGGFAAVSFVPAELELQYDGLAVPGVGLFLVIQPRRHPM